jgi:hypothetical protein
VNTLPIDTIKDSPLTPDGGIFTREKFLYDFEFVPFVPPSGGRGLENDVVKSKNRRFYDYLRFIK